MISVVIPLYNKADSIGRAVESVRNQTVKDWELVVVDDGSHDEGANIVTAFHDPRIRLVAQTNAGVSAARNRGVTEARSEWIAFLDADDYWDPAHIENLVGLIDRFPGSAMYATAYYVVSESGASRKIRLRHEGEGGYLMSDYFADVLEVEHPVHSSAVAINRRYFAQIDGFPVGVKAGEDIITWARLACIGTVAYSGKATASYVAPPVSAHIRDEVIRRPQVPDYVGLSLKSLQESCVKHAASLRLFTADWYRIRAMMFLELNERIRCLGELRQAVRLSKLRSKDVICIGLLGLPSVTRKQMLAWIRRNKARG
ncbi:glycosyltransferase family 2 protein [Uliginosibacterium sp. H3]|uniref:Glycosyltransferase family 2 protein n=1 Tax=Uliginosibacterium silvisoli TaxID=3114758 RepID=A0ABU6JZK1_9RHOO|nr:glycosyltransferase family 2 protein [Uliginosibacterium sp. H3]